MSSTGGVRELKKQRTRQLLEQRALELFERKGFEAATIDEIADAALVSPRTFFRYFGSKEDVVFGNHRHELAALRAAVAARPAHEPPEIALAEALYDFGDLKDGARDYALARAELIAKTPSLMAKRLLLQREWEDNLAEELAKRAGLEQPTLRLRVLAATGVAALTTATFVWVERGGRGSPAELIRQALDVVVAAN